MNPEVSSETQMKKIKGLILIVSLVLLPRFGHTQEPTRPKNAMFLELLGSGGLFSINYERNIAPDFAFRIGIGSWETNLLGGPKTKMTTVPMMLIYLTGQQKHHLEFNGGFLFGDKVEGGVSHSIFDLTAFWGYRYQSENKGFIFRIGLAAFLPLDNSANYPDKNPMVIPGISFGYHF